MHQFKGVVARATAIVAFAAVLAVATPVVRADGDTRQFNIAEQSLSAALGEFARQSDRQILYSTDVVNGKQSVGIKGDFSPEVALRQLLGAAGLTFRITAEHTILVEPNKTKFTPISMTGGDLHLAQAYTAPQTRVAQVDPVEPPPAADTGEGAVQEVTVTGTRIVRNGYEAPTPVTVVGAETIQDAAKPNIADVLNQMPAFQGSTTPTTSTYGNGGTSGGNNLNLRNLGPNRTLVLFNGRRYPPEFVTNIVDVNLMPDALIQRVDVVTGGASAVYGSDALAGVVNFVLDTNFTGFKGLVQGGITSHWDGPEDKVSLAWGTRFADGRGHFLIEGDQAYEAQILGTDREWNQRGYAVIQNPLYNKTTNPGVPQLITRYQVGTPGGYPGGLITAGPLRGTAFGPGGVPFQYDYGTLQSGQYNVGGDWRLSSMMGTGSIRTSSNTERVFTHGSFDVTDHFQVFAEYSNSFVHTDSRCCYPYYLGNLTVHPDNPYMDPAVAAAAAAAYPTGNIPYGITLRNPRGGFGTIIDRYNNVYVLGAQGDFDLFSTNWKWNAYAQRGLATMEFYVPYQSNTEHFMQAIDAVRAPNGQVVCRSTLTNPGNGCVPYNIFGTDVVDPRMIAYSAGGPRLRQTLGQTITGGSITGEPFSTWAGPVSLALSGEFRKDTIEGYNDPISNERGWFSTQLTAFNASQHVVEGALETVVPVAKDLSFAKELDINAGVRATDYSTSGYVTTWKIGATWQVLDDVRFRLTQSRDIRAPNLNDLFATPQTNHNTIADPFRNNQSFPYFQVQMGNPDLKPEKADTTGIGIVYQPGWLPGFQSSIDYYRIDTKDAIASVTYQYTLLQCFANPASPYCANVTRQANGTLDAIILRPQNQAELLAKGIDIEASYQMRLSQIVDSWQGSLGLRLVATDTLNLITDSGIAGPTQVLDAAGYTNTPKWNVNANLVYDLDPLRISWTTRFISSEQISNTLIECTTGCPNPVPGGFQTIDTNRVPSYSVTNVSGSWKFLDRGGSRNAEVYLSVDNLFNRDPARYPNQIAAAGYALTTNAGLYDTIGRNFRLGVRFRM